MYSIIDYLQNAEERNNNTTDSPRLPSSSSSADNVNQTVEINNSDAEGRLVLSDAVAHATKHYDDQSLVVDMV